MAETTIKFGNYIYEYGYVMISNLLLDYQNELKLTNDEVMFIIKVFRHKNGYKLHDSILDSTLSTKTLQRRRKSLVEKGYLEYRITKSTDNNGNIITEGIVYDFTALDIALSHLASSISEKEEQKKLEKETTIIPVIEPIINKSDVIESFKDEYKKKYKKDYNLSREEKEAIKKLSKREVDALKYIFEYFEENKDNLPKDFSPRIIFFTKVGWRMEQLISFADEYEERLNSDKEQSDLMLENRKAEERWWSLVESEEEDMAFTVYLRRNNPSLFVKKRNGMMINIIDELEVVYKSYKGEKNA